MRIRIRERGPAGKYAMWARYRDPQRWPEWAPHLRAVRAEGALRPGLSGEVVGIFGVRARFVVLDVDERAMRWSWRTQLGPTVLEVDHRVDEGLADLELRGSPPVVLAYAPVARLALRRLVRVERD